MQALMGQAHSEFCSISFSNLPDIYLNTFGVIQPFLIYLVKMESELPFLTNIMVKNGQGVNAMQGLMSYAHWEFCLIFLPSRSSVLVVKKAEKFN